MRPHTALFQRRAGHYRFFALSFLHQPDREEIRRFYNETRPSDGAFIDILLHTLSLDQDGWNALCAEYSALLEGTDGRFLPLWESAFSENGVLLNKTTLAVKQFYRRAGVKLSRRGQQLEDHIGVECAFMAYLWSQASFEAAHAFLREHLLPFGAFFCQMLKEATSNDYWTALADYFLRFLQGELEQDTPAVEATAWDLPTEETLLSLFDTVGPEERADPPAIRIPVAGINNCGGRCLLYAEVQDGAVLHLKAGKQPPEVSSEAQLPCVRGSGYRQTYLSTSRLRYPMRRVGKRGDGRFARITWDEALDELAIKMQEIKNRYGPASRYVNYATGVAGLMRGDKLARHLLALDGGYLGLYNTYSSACSEIATPYIYGTLNTGSTADTLQYAKLIVLWGHNPIETIFSPPLRKELMRAKKKGVRIISVDPRYSDSAAVYADEWIGIRPTTDSALIDALAYVILSEGLQDQHFMDTYCLGFDKAHMPDGFEEAETYNDYCLGRSDGTPKTPAWAAKITGIPEEAIVRLARKIACSKPTALLPGLGYQRHGNGEQAVRSLAMLACLTGNVGVMGGNAAGQNYVVQHRTPSAGIDANPLGVSIPSFLWTDAVARGMEMTPKDGLRGAARLPSPIKMIFNLAGNTLLNQHSDINRTADILKDTSLCEYIVCSDVFMTPSAKFADLLLPGTSMFETQNIHAPWDQGNYLLYNSGAIRPLYDARFEYDWLSELAERLGLYKFFTKGHDTMADWLRAAYEDTRLYEPELPPYDVFTKAGGHQYKNNRHFAAFEKEISEPANHPFPTPSGKIEIFSTRLYEMRQPDDIPAIPKYVPSFEGPADQKRAQFPLQLVGWHMKTRCHSIHFRSDPLNAGGEQLLWLHPEDAEYRGIRDGDTVTVRNDRGAVVVKAHVTDRIVRGVAAMPQGAWFRPDAAGVDHGGSINVLTTLRPTPLAKGNPQHSNLVEVERYLQDPEI